MEADWIDRDAVAGRVSGVDFRDLEFDPDNYLYRLAGEPFTGVSLSRWPDGRLASVVHWRDGLAHGVSVGWYFDGRPRVYNEMAFDVCDGLHKEWNGDGSVREEFRCHEGRPVRPRE